MFYSDKTPVYRCLTSSDTVSDKLHYGQIFRQFDQILAYVTGSAKKGHNRTSLNLQYKALNTLGEILAYY